MVMAALAYLPQHVAQVVGIAIGVTFVGFGTLSLVSGVPPQFAGGLNPRLARMLASLQIPLGIAIASAFFVIDAEGPYQRDEDQWGGAYGIVALVVFLVFLGGIAVFNLKKFRDAERRARNDPARRQ